MVTSFTSYEILSIIQSATRKMNRIKEWGVGSLDRPDCSTNSNMYSNTGRL